MEIDQSQMSLHLPLNNLAGAKLKPPSLTSQADDSSEPSDVFSWNSAAIAGKEESLGPSKSNDSTYGKEIFRDLAAKAKGQCSLAKDGHFAKKDGASNEHFDSELLVFETSQGPLDAHPGTGSMHELVLVTEGLMLGAPVGGLSLLTVSDSPFGTSSLAGSLDLKLLSPSSYAGFLTPQQKQKYDGIYSEVREALDKLGEKDRGFKVGMKMVPTLVHLEMDPVEFFTARACWQGTNKQKRRAILESVLDQFPKLPEDKKDWKSATTAAKGEGAEILESDEVFIKYFLENRQKMKSLFRATLPSAWRASNHVTVFRGQKDPSGKYEANSTQPLGCYSRDPKVALYFGDTKKYSVSFNEVWSTAEATQNKYITEQEITVYSPGGKRRGRELVKQDGVTYVEMKYSHLIT